MVNYSHIIGRVARLMKKPSVIDSPSGRVPKKASRWDRGRTEACGGGRLSLLSFWYIGNIWEFIVLELGQTGLGGTHEAPGHACPPPQVRPGGSWSPPRSSGLLSKLLVFFLPKKKSPKSFIVFGLRLILIFCETKTGQKTATGTGH